MGVYFGALVTMDLNHKLDRLRQEIDAVDLQIIKLLNERAGVAREIGRIKAEYNLSIENQEREAEILQKLSQHSQGPLPAEGAKKIFQAIIAVCRELQKKSD